MHIVGSRATASWTMAPSRTCGACCGWTRAGLAGPGSRDARRAPGCPRCLARRREGLTQGRLGPDNRRRPTRSPASVAGGQRRWPSARGRRGGTTRRLRSLSRNSAGQDVRLPFSAASRLHRLGSSRRRWLSATANRGPVAMRVGARRELYAAPVDLTPRASRSAEERVSAARRIESHPDDAGPGQAAVGRRQRQDRIVRCAPDTPPRASPRIAGRSPGSRRSSGGRAASRRSGGFQARRSARADATNPSAFSSLQRICCSRRRNSD